LNYRRLEVMEAAIVYLALGVVVLVFLTFAAWITER
jgi:hypothetical protein